MRLTINASTSMSAAPERIRRLAISGSVLSRDTICKTCLNRISRQSRQYAAAAAAAAPVAEQSSQQDQQPTQNKGLQKAYRLLIAPVVSRPPMLTRELTSFEKAYYLYQKRLNERLALPLTRYFYYKKGSPADVEWKRKIKSRQTAARDIGVYNAYGEFGWNDEVLLGDKTAEPETTRDALIRDAEGKDIVDADSSADNPGKGHIAGDAQQGEATQKELGIHVDPPASRVAQADTDNDTRSLSRKMDRILYLLVKNAEGRWRFPEDRMHGSESLYQAAERIIVQSAGINMNTWVVGNHPVAHFQYNYTQPKIATISHKQKPDSSAEESKQEEHGEKVFFMKARILAGQADLAKNIYGDSEFQWLAKEEIEKHVTPQYWAYIRNMLTER